jgi:hypothetical protein
MKTYEGSGDIAGLILIWLLDACELAASRPGRSISGERIPGTQFVGGPDLELATGEPNVRTLDLGAPYLSLSLSYNFVLLTYFCSFINFIYLIHYFGCNLFSLF